MKRLLLIIGLPVALGAPPGHADFVLANPSPPDAPDPRPEPSPPLARIPARPRAAIANGFGHQVPLSFAVRQIVPSSIRVLYGPDVDSSSPVDWTGGAPWGHVLAAAVEPLGLHLVFGKRTVLVRY